MGNVQTTANSLGFGSPGSSFLVGCPLGHLERIQMPDEIDKESLEWVAYKEIDTSPRAFRPPSSEIDNAVVEIDNARF